MGSRAVVVMVDSPEDRTKIRELAREVASRLQAYSKDTQRAVFLLYGQRVQLSTPGTPEFATMQRQRGAMWVGNYPGGIVSVEKLTDDLQAAMVDWRGEAHHG